MRLGVLDVGSNTVHLLVVDAHPGAAPAPAASVKTPLRLAELLHDDGTLGPDGAAKLADVVAEARREADAHGVEELLAFATSAVRDAGDSDDVLGHLREQTGVGVEVLPGEDEARLTFLAVRRWFGWSAGLLLALDIGGGSLEIAAGEREDPDFAASLPLGASRLTREWFSADPPPKSERNALRDHVRGQLEPLVEQVTRLGGRHRAVATSKTFRSLARIAGAAPSSEGPYVRRALNQADAVDLVDRLARMSAAQRAELPGVSPSRAGQLLAGAIVAREAMRLLDVAELEICPWALREGVILRRLDHLPPG